MSNMERLDKILSNMGYGSRKDVKAMIKSGVVLVNGIPVKNNDVKVNPYEVEIKVNGEVLNYRKYIYIMMNKPQGIVSSTEDPLTETVINLLDESYKIFNPFPVGRLDKDTEGLMFITNDGILAHELLSPKKGIKKLYFVEVFGTVDKEHIDIFKEGVLLDDNYKTLPAELNILESSTISKVELTIQEGKFHQVKRMFQSLGMKVKYLKRISIGPLLLDEGLKVGEYRELTEEEISVLKDATNVV